MPRYYLVRRNLETFIGPMTVKELASAYKRMEFGLQDEVAGHCGKWIAFEDISKIKRHYPELQPVVADVMLGGWGISGHGDQNIRRRQNKKRARPLLAMALVFIALIAGAGGVFLYEREELVLQFFAMSGPSPRHALEQYKAADPQEFASFMKKNLDTIRSEAMKNRPAYEAWLPFLRTFAYRNEGIIEGFQLRMLRGLERIAAPIDCSVPRWRNRWKGAAAEMAATSRGEEAGRKTWIRLISWDPHWIKARKFVSWLEPDSYFHFCVKLAREAYLSLIESNELGLAFKGAEPVRKRLDILNYILNGEPKELSAFSVQTPLQELSCLDAAEKLEDADGCVATANPYNQDWKNLIAYRYRLTSLRLVTTAKSLSPAEKALRITEISEGMGTIDPMSQLDYSNELKFYRLVAFLRGDVGAAARKSKSDAPDFSPPAD